jgi:hypothetical protein
MNDELIEELASLLPKSRLIEDLAAWLENYGDSAIQIRDDLRSYAVKLRRFEAKTKRVTFTS